MSGLGKVTVVMDSQAGSCGKGKFVAYMAMKDRPVVGINNWMSNAGHTAVVDGIEVMTQHLPSSVVCSDSLLMIGPGAAITPEILEYEINKYQDLIGDRSVFIHPRAMVIQPHHAEMEKAILRSGSTFKGCGAAQADKIMRVPGVQLMKDCLDMFGDFAKSKIEIADTASMANSVINHGGSILIEGSQGFDLDINYGLDYPHTTSRQCHSGQLLADCGIAPQLLTDTLMILRPYPIRISNQTNIGIEANSGDYAGSEELSWNIIKERCGAPADVELGEMTTVTKKLRRVFEFNWKRMEYAVMINRPTGLALNFAQYIDWGANGVRSWDALPYEVQDFVVQLENRLGVPVWFIGTGADNLDIVDCR